VVISIQEILVYDLDGNAITNLVQYDRDVYVHIKDSRITTAYHVHFFNSTSEKALVMNSTYSNGVLSVKIPNDLLYQPHTIIGYVNVKKNGESKCLYGFKIAVRKKPMPHDWVHVDSKDYVTFEEIIKECKKFAESASTSAANAKVSEIASAQSEKNAKDSETKAKISEQNAKTSETNAANSASSALTSANNAKASENKAKVSEKNAKVSETNAANSEKNAKLSETNAANSVASALTSANNAKISETNAKVSENAAKVSETNAKNSETKAKASETAAKNSETNAKIYSDNAKASEIASAQSEKNAKASETKAKISEQNAKTSEVNSKTSEQNAKMYADNAKASENNAKDSEDNAAISESNAKMSETNARASSDSASADASRAESARVDVEKYADLSKSYAIGTENVVRQNDKTDNAKYYYEQSKQITAGLSGVLLPMGTIAFADLSIQTKMSGYMFNISDSFVTDATFKDGAGVKYPAGTNVYYTDDGYWDCLVGILVTGVKGNKETIYRVGDVNLTPEDIGAQSIESAGIMQSNIDNMASDISAIQTNVQNLESDMNTYVKDLLDTVSTLQDTVSFLEDMIYTGKVMSFLIDSNGDAIVTSDGVNLCAGWNL